MALPPGIKTVTVEIGPYVSLTTGLPIRGQLTFRPSRWLIWQATGTPLVQVDRVVDLDEAGMATVVLPATDQTGFVDGNQQPVTRWTYRVTTNLTGVQQQPPVADIALLEGAPTIDLDLLVPVPSSTGVVVSRPEVLSVAGLSGVVSADALRAILGTGGGGGSTDPEVVRDTIGAALRGTGLTVTVNDAADTITLTPDVRTVAGKTGAVTLVKNDVGLWNVDNTSDADKPVSTATATALAGKADLVSGKVPASQLPTSTGGGATIRDTLAAVGEIDFDTFGSDDNARVTAMNAYNKAHGGNPSRAVRLPARMISTTVPIELYSGTTILGRQGPSREFSRGTIWNWQGASGTSCLVFPTDGQTNQSYPSDGSPRDVTMNNIQWQGSNTTHWMPRNSMDGTQIAGRTLWYCEFRDSAWKNFSTVWWGYTTGTSFATGVSFIQSIADTAIRLGGSETTVFGNDGYSFAASSTSSQTATPFMRSLLSKSTIGRCMITARGAGWGLTIEGGYNTHVTQLAIDAQDSSRINGKAILVTAGSGHVLDGVSYKGAMDAPSATASVLDRAYLVITGGTQLLVTANKFTRYQTNYGAGSPVIHVASSVADRAVVIAPNTYDRFNDPAVVSVARDGQVLTVDPRVSLVVGA